MSKTPSRPLSTAAELREATQVAHGLLRDISTERKALAAERAALAEERALLETSRQQCIDDVKTFFEEVRDGWDDIINAQLLAKIATLQKTFNQTVEIARKTCFARFDRIADLMMGVPDVEGADTPMVEATKRWTSAMTDEQRAKLAVLIAQRMTGAGNLEEFKLMIEKIVDGIVADQHVPMWLRKKANWQDEMVAFHNGLGQAGARVDFAEGRATANG